MYELWKATDERGNALYSRREIARRIHVTFNSLISRLAREVKYGNIIRRNDDRPYTPRQKVAKPPAPQPHRPPLPPPPVIKPLPPRGCQWPLWPNGQRARDVPKPFCGAPPVYGGSWCAVHHKVCFTVRRGAIAA